MLTAIKNPLEENWLFDHGWGNSSDNIENVFLRSHVEFDGYHVKVKTTHSETPYDGWMCKDDGILHMPKNYASGILISKEQFLYGDFECRVILPNFRGSWSAFWLYPHFDDGMHDTLYNEIDWYEQFRKDNFLSRHWIQAGLYKKEKKVSFNVHKKRKVWSLLGYHFGKREISIRGVWSKKEVTCYVNDRKVFCVHDQNLVPFRPMNVIVGNGVGMWKPKLSKDESKNDMLITGLYYNGKSLL